MPSSTLLFRLAIVATALVAAAVLLFGLAQQGRETGVPERRADLLTVEQATARLAELGHEVATLTRKGSLYRAELSDGRTLYLDATRGEIVEAPAVKGPALMSHDIERRLEAEGWREIGEVVWRRGRYETTAVDAEGKRFRLFLDTHSGELLERRAP